MMTYKTLPFYRMLLIGALSVAATACGSGTDPEPGASCNALEGAQESPTKIRIENNTGGPIFIVHTCGLDGVRVDGIPVLDTYNTFNCDDVLAGLTRPPEDTTTGCLLLDCFGGTPQKVEAGKAYEETWDGLVTGQEEVAVPNGCAVDTCQFSSSMITSCRKTVSATPGPHKLSVSYGLSLVGPFMDQVDPPLEFQLDFSLPAAQVTAAIEACGIPGAACASPAECCSGTCNVGGTCK